MRCMPLSVCDLFTSELFKQLAIMRRCLLSAIGLLAMLTGCVFTAAQAVADSGNHSQLVIIIDDLGNNLELGRRAVELPGALTYAILPHTPLAKKLAFYATQLDQRKDIIIHMPMASVQNKRLGPGGLETHHDQQAFVETLHKAFAAIPFASGLSNHMGSKLTALPDRMDWLMAELGKCEFYFVDSKTTGNSSAQNAAATRTIPYLSRDIFLDHDPSPAAIDKAYNDALQLARQKGIAVVIGHPYTSTLDYLEKALPQLANSDVTLISAGEALLLQTKTRYKTASHQQALHKQHKVFAASNNQAGSITAQQSY